MTVTPILVPFMSVTSVIARLYGAGLAFRSENVCLSIGIPDVAVRSQFPEALTKHHRREPAASMMDPSADRDAPGARIADRNVVVIGYTDAFATMRAEAMVDMGKPLTRPDPQVARLVRGSFSRSRELIIFAYASSSVSHDA